MTELLALSAPLLALAAGLALPLAPSDGLADRLSGVMAVAVGLAATGTAAWSLNGPPLIRGGVQLDALGSVFLLAAGVVGLASALVSPTYLSHHNPLASGRRWYHLGFYLFWAALLAIPLTANLGVAWLLIEATTGASALLVAYSGQRRALEAGWKYLVLTTLGFSVALARDRLPLCLRHAGRPGRIDHP